MGCNHKTSRRNGPGAEGAGSVAENANQRQVQVGPRASKTRHGKEEEGGQIVRCQDRQRRSRVPKVAGFEEDEE